MSQSSEITSAAPKIHSSPAKAMSEHNHCDLCGANLHFVHNTDFAKNLTLEVAKCPECGNQARRVMHRLQ